MHRSTGSIMCILQYTINALLTGRPIINAIMYRYNTLKRIDSVAYVGKYNQPGMIVDLA